MAGGPHQFDEAFAKLTATISDQVDGNGIIYLDENVQKPFESTFAPTSNQALQDFARIFEGDDNHSLFLRLDGCAIYLVVSTVLQFPPCSLLTKTVHFFMDMLDLYAHERDAQHTLQAHLREPILEKEIGKRQKYIFSQLIPRLKSLLFESGKHYKVKRLIAQLIARLCHGDARGWQELMNAQERGLFGTLLNQVDDYVLRVLIADIIRHLLANNYDIGELWEQSSEEVLDFPASQELHSTTISKVLDSISALDAKQAFKDTRQRRLYRIVDINIPDMQYHSAKSDTILIVDDSLILLMPDRTCGGTVFAVYEIPVTRETCLEDAQSPTKQASHLRICWKNAQGYIILRGKKERVKDIRIQLAEQSCHDDFCEAFSATSESQARSSWPAASQENVNTTPQPLSIVVKTKGFSSTEHEFGENLCTRRDKGIHNLMDGRSISARDTLERVSSEAIIETAVTSDVFAFGSDEDQNLKKKPTHFSNRLRFETISKSSPVSPPMLLSSHEDGDGDIEASSPLKNLSKGNNGEEVAIRSREVTSTNPALNLPLHQHNDVDYTSLLGTASRLRTSNTEETSLGSSLSRKATYRSIDPTEHEKSRRSSRASKNILQKVRPTTDVSTSTSNTRARGVTAAPKKKPQTTSSFIESKNSELQMQKQGPIEPSVNEEEDSTEEHTQTQTQTLARKKMTEMNISGKHASNNVDWDEALRTDAHKTKRQKVETKVSTKTQAKKPLKDVTNASQTNSVPRRPIGHGKAGNKSQAMVKKVNTISAASVAPARRPQRTTVQQAKSYAESSASEDGVASENSPEGRNKRGARRDKSSSPAQIQPLGIIQQKKGKMKPLSIEPRAVTSSQRGMTTKASQDGSTVRPLIEVPSSDHEDEIADSLPKEVSLRSRDGQEIKGSAIDADTQVEEEAEVLEDSYPRQDSESLALATAADKSFGTRLSNLIATTPAMAAERTLQTSNTPLGDSKQFVHNINGAKKLKDSFNYSTVTSAIAPTTATLIKSSEALDTASVPTKNQQVLESIIPIKYTSIREDVGTGAASAQTGSELPLSPRHETNSQIEDPEISMPVNVEVSKIVRGTTLDTEIGTVQSHTLSPPFRKAAVNSERQSQTLSHESEKSDNLYYDDDDAHMTALEVRRSAEAETLNRPIAQPSSETVVGFQPSPHAPVHHTRGINRLASSRGSTTLSKAKTTVNASGLMNDPQHYRTTSMKSQGVHGSRASDTASIGHRRRINDASESGQISTTASSKTAIIHFGSVGPQNQGSPSKARSVDMSKIHQQPAGAKDLTYISPSYKNTDPQSRGVPGRSEQLDDQLAAQNFEDDSQGLISDAAIDEMLQDSVVPSLSTVHVKKANLSSRRSDRAGRPHQNSPVILRAPVVVPEKIASVEPEQSGQLSQSQSQGSSLELPLCISSTQNTPEADSDKGLLHEVDAKPAACEVEIIPQEPQHREAERRVKEFNDHNTVPFNSTTLGGDQRVPTVRPVRTKLPEPIFVPVTATLLPMERRSFPAPMLPKDDSRLFSVNTVARKIFGQENTSKLSGKTNLTDQSREFELPQATKSIGEAVVTPRDEAVRPGKHNRPSVPNFPSTTRPVQVSNQRPRQENLEPAAMGLKKATADGRDKTVQHTTGNLNIVRVKQQQPSQDENLESIQTNTAPPISTPRAFVQQLHASTSPVPATRILPDRERTRDFLPDNSDFGQTTLVGQPYISHRMKLQNLVQNSTSQISSSSISPESEAGHSTIVRSHQQRSILVQSVSRFASRLQQTVLDITQEIAARVDSEEKLAKSQIEDYHVGSLEVARKLRSNNISRLDYDAKKLATVLREQQNLVANAKLHLSQKPSPATRCEQVSNSIEQHRMDILAMLDNVSH